MQDNNSVIISGIIFSPFVDVEIKKGFFLSRFLASESIYYNELHVFMFTFMSKVTFFKFRKYMYGTNIGSKHRSFMLCNF